MADAKAHNASALSVSTGQSCQNPIKELQWSCPWRDFILTILFVTALLQISSLFLPSSSPVSQVVYAVNVVVSVTLLCGIQRSPFSLMIFLSDS